MIHRPQRYKRTTPREWRDMPFYGDAEKLPSLPEALGWIILAAVFVTLCVGFLGVDLPVGAP